MEPEGSLSKSQVPAIYPYPEPAQTSRYPHILLHSFLFYHLNMWEEGSLKHQSTDTVFNIYIPVHVNDGSFF